MQQGRSFLGFRTRRAKVLILTEEGLTTFRNVLARVGLSDSEDLIVVSKRDLAKELQWPEVASHAVSDALLLGAEVPVVDTLTKWVGLQKDTENDSGTADYAMGPLEHAAQSGLAVIVVRHATKPERDVRLAGRGLSAFTGAVDISVNLTRSGDAATTRRVLSAVGRFDETPEQVMIELREGSYVALGTGSDAVSKDAAKLITVLLPRDEEAAITEAEVLARVKDANVTKGAGASALRDLLKMVILIAWGKVKGGTHSDTSGLKMFSHKAL